MSIGIVVIGLALLVGIAMLTAWLDTLGPRGARHRARLRRSRSYAGRAGHTPNGGIFRSFDTGASDGGSS